MDTVVPDSMGDADDDYIPPRPDTAMFTCKPETAGPHDTLTLWMWTPHGGEVEITSPGDTSYSLVYPRDRPEDPYYSIVSSDAFMEDSTLRVPLDIRLPPEIYGRDSVPERVFRTSGQYKLMLGEKLHSDHGPGIPVVCYVNFVTGKI